MSKWIRRLYIYTPNQINHKLLILLVGQNKSTHSQDQPSEESESAVSIVVICHQSTRIISAASNCWLVNFGNIGHLAWFGCSKILEERVLRVEDWLHKAYYHKSCIIDFLKVLRSNINFELIRPWVISVGTSNQA